MRIEMRGSFVNLLKASSICACDVSARPKPGNRQGAKAEQGRPRTSGRAPVSARQRRMCRARQQQHSRAVQRALARTRVDDEEVGIALLVNVAAAREQHARDRVVIANHGEQAIVAPLEDRLLRPVERGVDSVRTQRGSGRRPARHARDTLGSAGQTLTSLLAGNLAKCGPGPVPIPWRTAPG